MTDTIFFIPTKAAFEHASEVGSIVKVDADDWMYMNSDKAAADSPPAWIDSFKHRETRKYVHVRRYTYIAPSEPAFRPPENNVHAGTEPGAKSAARIKEITEARAEFNRFEKVRDAGPQLLEALKAIVACDGKWPDGSSDRAMSMAYAAIKAATGWAPGDTD